MELDFVQQAYNRFIGSLMDLFYVYEDININDPEQIGAQIKYYESVGFRLLKRKGNPIIETSSGWHFTNQGIKNVLDSRLEVGNPLVLEALRAHDFTRLKVIENIFYRDPIVEQAKFTPI